MISTNENSSNKALVVKYLSACAVGVVTFIVFLPTLQNDFINWDDSLYVYENPLIRSFDTQLLISAFGDFYAGFWHPLTWISHALDYAIWGLNPMGHHLTNNILHAINAFLVVILITRLVEAASGRLKSSKGSLVAAVTTGLLFGLHPLRVESVAWVAERKDLLCGLFYLLSIVAYTSYAAHKSYRTYFISLGLFVLALLSKPMAVSLPAVLLILDWYPFRRIESMKSFWKQFAEKLPFIALSLASSILTIMAQKAFGAVSSVEVIPLPVRATVAAKALIAYLGKMLLPINLIPFYPYPHPKDVSLFSIEYLAAIVLVAGITTACLILAKKHKLFLAVWGYYVITLMPAIGIVQVGGQAMADRFTYLPSLGPFLVIGILAAKVNESVENRNQKRVTLRIAGFLTALAVFILISYLTIMQIGIWKSSSVFWNYVINYAIEKGPSGALVAHNNLGDAYASEGRFDMAIMEYQAALREKPDSVDAHYNLGHAYLSQGRFDMAIMEYQTALKLKPDFADAHNNLGNAYSSQARFDMAIIEYQAALRLNPDYAVAHYNLGNAYSSQGRFDMAIIEYQAALKLKPDFVEAQYNLNRAYSSQGRFDMAK